VLDLMAQGRSNAAISEELHVSDSATTKHISLFAKLGLHASLDDNRRVLAVHSYLNERSLPGTGSAKRTRISAPRPRRSAGYPRRTAVPRRA
jgi:hypothetical protein